MLGVVLWCTGYTSIDVFNLRGSLAWHAWCSGDMWHLYYLVIFVLKDREDYWEGKGYGGHEKDAGPGWEGGRQQRMGVRWADGESGLKPRMKPCIIMSPKRRDHLWKQ